MSKPVSSALVLLVKKESYNINNNVAFITMLTLVNRSLASYLHCIHCYVIVALKTFLTLGVLATVASFQLTKLYFEKLKWGKFKDKPRCRYETPFPVLGCSSNMVRVLILIAKQEKDEVVGRETRSRCWLPVCCQQWTTNKTPKKKRRLVNCCPLLVAARTSVLTRQI